jgi:acylphosphatase
MMESMKAVQARVSGRVQGVSFRWYTEEQARRLGVVGWVRNEPDGTVLVHAEGEDEAVDALVAWCRQGPAMARVSGVAVREAAPTGATGFETRY